MRLLMFIGFIVVLGLIEHIRGRQVTWKEQCAWMGGIFITAFIWSYFELW